MTTGISTTRHFKRRKQKKEAEEGEELELEEEEEETTTRRFLRSHTQSQQLTGERRIGEGGRRGEESKEYIQQSREHQPRREEEEAHIPDTLEQQIAEWMDKAGIILNQTLRPTETNKKDTTHNSNIHTGKGGRKRCTCGKADNNRATKKQQAPEKLTNSETNGKTHKNKWKQ